MDPTALARQFYDPDLCSGATQVVPGEGNPKARLVIVGEAPGEQEDRQGRPFVGRAGKLLDRLLVDAGISREDVYITNAVKCRPTLESNGKLKNRPPRVGELRHWQESLRLELDSIRPEVILALGAVAGKALTGVDVHLAKNRGLWLSDQWLHIPLRLSYHPAFLLRQAGDSFQRLYAEALIDYQAVLKVLK